MSDAGEWTLISPLASFRCRLDDIFFCLSLSYLGGGGLVLRILSLKMSTRGASRLFTGIRLDDDDEVEEVFPSTQRPPIAASDGTSGSSHVFSTPNSHATTQVGDGEGNRDLSKVGLFCVRDVDEICGGIVGKVDGNGALCSWWSDYKDCYNCLPFQDAFIGCASPFGFHCPTGCHHSVVSCHFWALFPPKTSQHRGGSIAMS
jgi:hypothetical protein